MSAKTQLKSGFVDSVIFVDSAIQIFAIGAFWLLGLTWPLWFLAAMVWVSFLGFSLAFVILKLTKHPTKRLIPKAMLTTEFLLTTEFSQWRLLRMMVVMPITGLTFWSAGFHLTVLPYGMLFMWTLYIRITALFRKD